jgi:hypothetical protein
MEENFSRMTQEELSEHARVYGCNDDVTVSLDAISWSYEPSFDVSRLLEVMTEKEWADWLDEEIEMSVTELDDPDRWAPLLEQEIFEPIVIFDHRDGTIHIWDGWHRSAAAVAKGAKTMKAIYGTAPEYALDMPVA